MNKQSLNGRQCVIQLGVVEVSLFLMFLMIPLIQLLMTAFWSVSIILAFPECVIEATDRRLIAVAWSCVRVFSSEINEDGNMNE